MLYPYLDDEEVTEAKSILFQASDRTGWNIESMLDVICDYVNQECDVKDFCDYVNEVMSEELGIQDIDDDDLDYEDE